MLTVSEREVASRRLPPVRIGTARRAAQRERAPDRPRRSRWHLSTTACFGASVLTIVVAVALASLGAPYAITGPLGLVGTVLFSLSILVALYRSARGIVALVRPAPGRTSGATAARAVTILGNLFMAAFGMLVAYVATVGFSRGRQLRRRGRVLLPGLRSDPAWASLEVSREGIRDAPAGVADQWRENGKTEHASVAAFARLTLDLMALGAPPSLIRAASQDALDEIRHGELCFALASALDGKAVSPAAFPEAQRVRTLPRSQPLALAKLAVDSLVDGALHEGVSARIIAKLAERCEKPAIRVVLRQIAADEGRHAAHGWAAVEWCLEEGGRPVANALLGAIRVLPGSLRSARPEPAARGEWERWGIQGDALESQQYQAALAHLTERVRTKVGALSRNAA